MAPINILVRFAQMAGIKNNMIDKIVKKFKLPPSGIHEEISPRYRGVLENGDTVPVGESTRVGDTVSYIYYKMK